MVAHNLELKARDTDHAASVARCVALGAQDGGVLHQRDTYYATRHGRLKLREIDGAESELIAYRRPDTTDPEQSAYVRAPVGAPAALGEALDAGLGVTVVVVKRRRLFLWEDVRIHLDEVDGLGAFIEFEALLGPGRNDPAQAAAKLERLRSELRIDDAALVAVGYSDLLLAGRDALVLAAGAAMRNAYAPYSGFRVGAAVRAVSGAIYVGANVENAAYPQSQCAEASALGALVTAGETRLTAVAVVAEREASCPPCGGCRQRLSEFGGPDTPVHLGELTVTLGELLPHAFGREDLDP